MEPTEVFETLDARQFLPAEVMAEGVARWKLEDFGGFSLSGRHPFASGPSTGIDRQQFYACSYPVGISVGRKSASTIKEAGENASNAISKLFNLVYWELRSASKRVYFYVTLKFATNEGAAR